MEVVVVVNDSVVVEHGMKPIIVWCQGWDFEVNSLVIMCPTKRFNNI